MKKRSKRVAEEAAMPTQDKASIVPEVVQIADTSKGIGTTMKLSRCILLSFL